MLLRLRHIPSRLASGAQLSSGIFLLLVAMALGPVLPVGPVVAPVQAQPEAFLQAKNAYEFGDKERAISLFSKVAQDTTAAETYRRDALLHLGRMYVAYQERRKARKAMRQLLQLEPPPVRLDPTQEPPPLIDIYYKTCKEIRGTYAVQRDDPGLQTLAIIDFRNSSVQDTEKWEPLSRGLPSLMNTVMNGATDLQVIQRERVEWILNEIELQQKADVVDQSTAVRAGKLLGATTVLFGNYTVLGDDQMVMTAQLVEVETSKILLADKVVGSPDNVPEIVQKLSKEITRKINVELEEEELGNRSATRSTRALLAFSDGLEAIERNDYQAAKEYFEQALEYDPDYEKARKRLQGIQTFLAQRN